MKLHRYLGCVYDLLFEEIDIRFLVHRNLIGDNTRGILVFYVTTGHLPEGTKASIEGNTVRLAPEEGLNSINDENDKDFLWFVL